MRQSTYLAWVALDRPLRDNGMSHLHNVFVFCNPVVLIEVDIGAALQNQQLLRKTSALLVRCGEGSFSRGCRAAVRRSGRHRVGVGTNRQRLCHPCARYNPPNRRR